MGAAFLKAIGPDSGPVGVHVYRREARVARCLPVAVPAPRLLWSATLVDGWVGVLFDHVDGHHPARPWTPADLEQVIDGVTATSIALTPSPTADVPRLMDFWADLHTGWRTIATDPTLAAHLTPWARDHLDDLVAAEARWDADGTSLVHGDLSADNVLLTDDGVVFLDWSNATVGAGWTDIVELLLTAHTDGLDVERLLGRSPLTASLSADQITCHITALTGFLTLVAISAPDPDMPSVHPEWQRRSATGLAWLQRRSSAAGDP